MPVPSRTAPITASRVNENSSSTVSFGGAATITARRKSGFFKSSLITILRGALACVRKNRSLPRNSTSVILSAKAEIFFQPIFSLPMFETGATNKKPSCSVVSVVRAIIHGLSLVRMR